MRSARSAYVFFLVAVLLAAGLQGGLSACPYERPTPGGAAGADAPSCSFAAGSSGQPLLEIHRDPVPALQALPGGARVFRTAAGEPAMGGNPSAPARAVPLYLQKASLLI